MSAERSFGAIVCGFAVCSGAVALAADDEPPDTEFLEYLGMWDESDEDWLVLDETISAEKVEQSDPRPSVEESSEKDDEH